MGHMEGLRRLCIDTDVLIDYLRGPSAVTKLLMKKIHEERIQVCTTAVNSFEIWLGVSMASNPEALTITTERFMSQLEIIGLNYETSVEAGRILANLRKEGQTLEIRVVFVGSIAKLNDISLVTRNTRHYQRIHELSIMIPEEALRN